MSDMYKSYKKDDKVLPKTSWSSYQDDDLDSENDMDNNDENLDNDDQSDHDDNDLQDDNGKGKNKKKYSVISQAVREKFIKRVLSKEVTIKEAAKEFGLKFSTSKAILQTYKKEGRIGKKKNRERKTKVVNAVFIANISASNPFVSSLPAPLNDIKNINLSASTEASTGQQYDSSGFNKYTDPKAAKGAMPGGFNNKATQNIIKEFGNDFLRDFIEKNFGQNRIAGLGPGPYDRNMGGSADLNNLQSNANLSSTINLPSMGNQRPVFNFGTSNTTTKVNQVGFNPLAGLSNTSLLPQKISSINSDGIGQQGFNLNQNRLFNPVRQSTLEDKNGQKRSFQNYEKDNVPELGRNESINDISVKKFKSGEDNLWDFDMDRSKKDLEDFIYKTHNAMKSTSMNESKPISNFADFS